MSHRFSIEPPHRRPHLLVARAPRAPRLITIALLASSLVLGFTDLARAQVDRELEARIAKAIERGRESLWPHLGRLTKNPPREHGPGRIGIVLTAILKSGGSVDHPLVSAAFERLETVAIEQTYDAAVYIFALDALVRARYANAWVGNPASGARPRATGRTRAKIEELIAWLVEARSEGLGTWTYAQAEPGSRRHDFSNTQFAVLALQIGLEHQVTIPPQVFVEIAEAFLRSQKRSGEPHALRLTYADGSTVSGRADSRRGRTTTANDDRRTVVQVRVEPSGWGYRESDRDPYHSMTAAGASSLLVARSGLGRRIRPNLQRSIDATLHASYAWIATRFEEFLAPPRSFYYTLYSLEKVGDLSGIEAFDGRDWYAEGARILVDRQRDDGSWGAYPDTALALLFLTRATRLGVGSPVIYTSGEGTQESSIDADLVYIPELDGFVSARQTLRYAAESRDPALVRVVEGVIEHHNPTYRGDLVAPLLELWSEKEDRFTRVAREAIQAITGIKDRAREPYEGWAERWAAIGEWRSRERGSKRGERSDANGGDEEIERWIRETENPVLVERLLIDVHTLGRRDLAHCFIDKLATVDDPLLLRRIHEYLSLWPAAPISMPSSSPARESREELARRWRAWWRENGSRLRSRREAALLIAAIEERTRAGLASPGSPADREVQDLLERLVALGDDARAEIAVALTSEDASFHIIEALERIDAKPIGLRALKR